MTPDLQLRTLYVLDADGRMLSTREPGTRRPPVLALIRGREDCVWALRADISDDLAAELGRLAAEEPAVTDLSTPPLNAERCEALVGGHVESGPAFAFPDEIAEPGDVVPIGDPAFLGTGFPELVDEIDGRAPMLAVVEDGRPVSICFCARSGDEAAEAGLDTLESYRGRGFGPRATAAWALAIRASGRIPLYSTAWTNEASRAVARKLGLIAYASDWNLYD